MRRYQNLLMMLAVIVLVAIPLWMVQKPESGPDGNEVEIFRGADDQAKDLISKIAPEYKPWIKPLMEPPSGEIGSLLFALQAAAGAGFIGYYLGMSVTRSKMQKEMDKGAQC